MIEVHFNLQCIRLLSPLFSTVGVNVKSNNSTDLRKIANWLNFQIIEQFSNQ